MAPHAQRVHALVSRVQVLVWAATIESPSAVIDSFEQLCSDIPPPGSNAERLLFGTILSDTLSHLRRAFHLQAQITFEPAVDADSFARELGRLKQAVAPPAPLHPPSIDP